MKKGTDAFVVAFAPDVKGERQVKGAALKVELASCLLCKIGVCEAVESWVRLDVEETGNGDDVDGVPRLGCWLEGEGKEKRARGCREEPGKRSEGGGRDKRGWWSGRGGSATKHFLGSRRGGRIEEDCRGVDDDLLREKKVRAKKKRDRALEARWMPVGGCAVATAPSRGTVPESCRVGAAVVALAPEVPSCHRWGTRRCRGSSCVRLPTAALSIRGGQGGPGPRRRH
jgi:hypothetical protein